MELKKSQDERYQTAAEEYGVALVRIACAYEADAELRKDLLQEIHLALWRSFAIFDGRCSVRTWVYRVAHNVATSHVVRQTKGKTLRSFLSLEEAETRTAGEGVESSTDRALAVARLFDLIRELDPVDRQVISAYLEDLDAESIAEVTGLSPANVWSKIHRIKNLLVRRFHGGNRNVLR